MKQRTIMNYPRACIIHIQLTHVPFTPCQFSPNGKRLAIGGSDAVVGLWDVDTMCCCHTVTRCIKFIRGVAFSHDNMLVCCSTEEDSIDIADASTGAAIGIAKLGGRGAEEIAFHPSCYLLACARIDSGMIPTAPVTVVKLSVGSA
jgi:THO complex subunit 3